ncbi:ABC transporter permease [Desulfoscipio gibsoniae]|uniref:Transport permease protein n=1 Tax=Desulfoscipio gibsoniae DSM 7213 TaxID=767817 RepID=R4KVY7_9FIRM|nr:ABC transporter permease [Desulfoscipio gibsoniae]AGL03786.1 ABC-type polysaccharide/polyol phosphate export systems, permease component [Desulfoscipio gibsoniae DSM 7213]
MYKKLILYSNLTIALAWRDVRVRYQLSVLGLYWAIINPLLMAIIWSFVFSYIFRATGLNGIPYVVFLFCGLTYWNLFANSLSNAATSLTGNAMLLSKVYFPRIILPTAAVIARLVDFAFSMLVLVLIIWYYNLTPVWDPLVLLPLLAIEFFYTLGLAYIVASLNVLYRDVAQLVNIILMFWLYLSPIFYILEQVPEKIRSYFAYNTIGLLVDMQRNVLLAGDGANWHLVLISLLISIGVFILGWLVFHWLEPLFAEVM